MGQLDHENIVPLIPENSEHLVHRLKLRIIVIKALIARLLPGRYSHRNTRMLLSERRLKSGFSSSPSYGPKSNDFGRASSFIDPLSPVVTNCCIQNFRLISGSHTSAIL
jgi:hypothetical protein